LAGHTREQCFSSSHPTFINAWGSDISTQRQMYLTESYNSPQSVYWAMKSLIIVGIAADDMFWKEAEVGTPKLEAKSAVKTLLGPRQLLCNHPGGNHHFLLSTAQFVGIPFKGIAAKYSKFAYSSSFGFSVPTGTTDLAQLAPDSTLALSRDGTETWAVKQRCAEPEFKTAIVHGNLGEEVPAATMLWYPWADRSVAVYTTVLPPTTRWPDWHVRIHRIKANKGVGRIFTAEGGFAIHGCRRGDTRPIPSLDQSALTNDTDVGGSEGIFRTDTAVLLLSGQGASGIASRVHDPGVARTALTPLKPEPNTNVMRQRTLIPLVERDIDGIRENGQVLLVTMVFAISQEANGGWRRQGKTLRERWQDQPLVSMGIDDASGDYMSLAF
jgi:hypothetical protein